MLLCDLTHAYHATSGGIRTFIDVKRRYLLARTPHSHSLIIPGSAWAVERGERWITHHVPAPRFHRGSPYRFFVRPGGLLRALNEARPDLVELNTYYAPAEARAAFQYRAAARRTGRRVAISVHYHTDFVRSYARTYVQKAAGGPLGRLAERAAVPYVRAILSRADVAFALNPEHHAQMEQLGARRALLLPQFVDLEMFSPAHADPAVRVPFGVGPDDLLMIYSGRFDSEKHVDMLVATFERLPSLPRAALVMMGEGPSRPVLEAAALRLPGLHILPYQKDRAQVARLLASADVYVTAGPHEVNAFSAVEAHASGLPVVGVRAGGLIQRVPDGTGFLVPVDDAEAMAACVLRAFERRSELKAAARAYAEAHYGWEGTFDPIVAAYEDVLG